MPRFGDRWFHRRRGSDSIRSCRRLRWRSNPRLHKEHHLAANTLNVPDFRDELVVRIRREIREGTYDSPEKLEEALDRMIARLTGE